jgi:hypothetical protein
MNSLARTLLVVLTVLLALPQALHARWYDAELGRWLMRDPAGYPDGPNQYQYVRSDPITHVDPTGLVCCCCTEGLDLSSSWYVDPDICGFTIGVQYKYRLETAFPLAIAFCSQEWWERSTALLLHPETGQRRPRNTWYEIDPSGHAAAPSFRGYHTHMNQPCPGGPYSFVVPDRPSIPNQDRTNRVARDVTTEIVVRWRPSTVYPCSQCESFEIHITVRLKRPPGGPCSGDINFGVLSPAGPPGPPR